MAANVERKEYPISMRLPEADVAMIDRAASLRGRSRTDFVRDAAVRAAEDVIMEHRLVRMSPEGFADFVEILSRPAAPVAEMVELVSRPAPWEAGDGAKR
ncbi:MAG: type II toxin-antitoxin system TacA family antitoxin [Ferrovibrionaceae bacterium]